MVYNGGISATRHNTPAPCGAVRPRTVRGRRNNRRPSRANGSDKNYCYQ